MWSGEKIKWVPPVIRKLPVRIVELSGEDYILTGIEIEEYPDPDMDIENDLSNIENIPEILEAVLTQKKMLPALLGLDKEFDRLITEGLKE